MAEASLAYHDKQHNSAAIKKAEKGISILLNNIGLVYKKMNKYKVALDYCKRSLVLKEKLGDIEKKIFPMTSIGEIYMKLGDYVQAANYAEKSLLLAEKVNKKKLIKDAYYLLYGIY